MSSAFTNALTGRPLVGPTKFEPLIRKAMALAGTTGGYASSDTHKYIVFVILTDGKFTDKQKTIEAVVQASTLPLSIMFVGVGDDPVCASHHPLFSHIRSVHPSITI